MIAPDGFENFLVLLGHVHGSLLLRGEVRAQLVESIRRGRFDSVYIEALRDELGKVVAEANNKVPRPPPRIVEPSA